MKKQKVIVLGAGITGLTTAWMLAKSNYDVIVLEKDAQVGGLAGTIDWDNWKFDFGAHSFHTTQEEMAEFYKRLLGSRFSRVTVEAKLYIFQRLIAYPLLGAHIFYVLNSKTMMKAGFDFFLTRLKAVFLGIKETDRLDEWIVRRFGQVLYDIYFSHYIERIQKRDPKYLSKDIGEKKIPVFRIRQYIKREIFKSKRPHPEDISALKYYYCKGGYGEIPQFFYDELLALNSEINLEEPVRAINITNDKVVSIVTDKKSYDCSECAVVSTIPLRSLIASITDCEQSVRKAANDLEYTKLRLLLVKVNKKRVMGYRWVNFSDKRFPFYRVSECSYDEFRVVPEDKCSLIFELPLKEEDPLRSMDDKHLAAIVFPLFNEVFELRDRDVIAIKSVIMQTASPIMSLQYQKSLATAFQHIENIENLYSIGRHGLFTYINLDGCTKMGLEFAEKLIRGNGKKGNRDLLDSFHNIGRVQCKSA